MYLYIMFPVFRKETGSWQCNLLWLMNVEKNIFLRITSCCIYTVDVYSFYHQCNNKWIIKHCCLDGKNCIRSLRKNIMYVWLLSLQVFCVSMRFEIVKAVIMYITIFWDVILCIVVDIYWPFFFFFFEKNSATMKMEVPGFAETLVNIYQTT